MRKFIFSMALFASVFAISTCVEYEISDSKVVIGEANPAPVPSVKRLDRITQLARPKTDVLWVIDHSCSMYEEQTALTNNFDAFINYFIGSGLDWHVGVVSMDMTRGDHKGRLRTAGGLTYLDESSPSPAAIFREMAAMGTSGSGIEQGLATSYAALEEHRNDFNQGFYRNDAMLNIIVISDEEDQTTEIGLGEYIAWLKNLKSNTKDVTFSSIVCLQTGTLNGVFCGEHLFSAMSTGIRYITVTEAIGGVLWDIRETDWSEVLEELGELAVGLKREFFLSDIPIPETLDVWVDIPDPDGEGKLTYSFKQHIDYIYSDTRNSITFITYLPPQYSQVHIKYSLLSSNYGESLEDSGK